MRDVHKQNIKVAVDAVVFSILNGELSILLIERKYPPFKGSFAIPGGFIKEGEELEDAVKRELEEETNIKKVWLKQIGTYGSVKRDPRGRVISITYLALISADQDIKATTDAADVKWFPIASLPKLAFDHTMIISDCLRQLRYEIQTTNIAYQVLPSKFTLTQMQSLYETVLGKKLDKRNFRKRVKELNILRETKETWMEGAHRPAVLYNFKEQKYDAISNKVNVFLN